MNPFFAQASAIIDEREKNYGPSVDCFDKIAKRWSITLGQDITPQQVIMCMIDLKLIRLSYDPLENGDSIFDIAGYACCLDKVNNRC